METLLTERTATATEKKALIGRTKCLQRQYSQQKTEISLHLSEITDNRTKIEVQ